MKRHQTNFLQGTYVQMQFDANPHTLQDLRSTLKVDPRVIRVDAIKLGEKLNHILPKAI
ncbi:hypothetical protein DSO57_1027347 [Entomophthora muscae]|uniref:Uncharacterized protein n=1 Tax=Entomophthora muscae TaxID=34485 RepID=A0ACC2U066_9FUNG|nr:hypothetical protein DSO57_1027347 [Entomophthora muscae]